MTFKITSFLGYFMLRDRKKKGGLKVYRVKFLVLKEILLKKNGKSGGSAEVVLATWEYT